MIKFGTGGFRAIIGEDFTNYKEPSMFLIFPYCNLKCDIENGNQIWLC